MLAPDFLIFYLNSYIWPPISQRSAVARMHPAYIILYYPLRFETIEIYFFRKGYFFFGAKGSRGMECERTL